MCRWHQTGKQNHSQLRKFFLILFSFAVLSLAAQDNRHAHFFGFAANAGYLGINDTAAWRNGGEGLADFVYEYHYRHFILQTGAGIGYARLTSPHVQAAGETPGMVDNLGYEYTLRYSTSKVENFKYGKLQVPIMLGAGWDKIYFLAGAKVGFNFYGQSVIDENISMTADYEMYVTPLPLENRIRTTKAQQVPFTLDARLSAEVGFMLTPTPKLTSFGSLSKRPLCRLGVYFESGVIPISDLFKNPTLDIAAGLRLTILFTKVKKANCMCSEW